MLPVTRRKDAVEMSHGIHIKSGAVWLWATLVTCPSYEIVRQGLCARRAPTSSQSLLVLSLSVGTYMYC